MRFHLNAVCEWELNLIQIGISIKEESLVIKILFFCTGKYLFNNTIRQISLKFVQKLTEISFPPLNTLVCPK